VSVSDPMFFTVTVSLLRCLPAACGRGPAKAPALDTPSEGIVDDPRLDTSHDRPSVATATAQIAPAGVPHGAAETLCPPRVAAVGHVASLRRAERSATARLALGACRISILENVDYCRMRMQYSEAHAVPPRPMHRPEQAAEEGRDR